MTDLKFYHANSKPWTLERSLTLEGLTKWLPPHKPTDATNLQWETKHMFAPYPEKTNITINKWQFSTFSCGANSINQVGTHKHRYFKTSNGHSSHRRWWLRYSLLPCCSNCIGNAAHSNNAICTRNWNQNTPCELSGLCFVEFGPFRKSNQYLITRTYHISQNPETREPSLEIPGKV